MESSNSTVILWWSSLTRRRCDMTDNPQHDVPESLMRGRTIVSWSSVMSCGKQEDTLFRDLRGQEIIFWSCNNLWVVFILFIITEKARVKGRGRYKVSVLWKTNIWSLRRLKPQWGRCYEGLHSKTDGSTFLTYTGLCGELEHLMIETRLTGESFECVMGECVS